MAEQIILPRMVVGCVRGTIARQRNDSPSNIALDTQIRRKELGAVFNEVGETYDLPLEPENEELSERWTVATLGEYLWKKLFNPRALEPPTTGGKNGA